jgi:mannose-6-phosphate isomerase
MRELFKLRNQVKHYEWGSPEWIPRIMGAAHDETLPWAELWMGSHPGAPSFAGTGSGEVRLGELIAGNPPYYLGEQAAKQYGELPFLFKLLAAEKPLSIQAHPSLAQAREGFERENNAGLAIDAPNRNYRDANHKPEIICALGPFTGMCGFREPEEIRRLLTALLTLPRAAALREGFAPLFTALQEPSAPESASSALRNLLAALFALPAETRQALGACILNTTEAEAEEAGIVFVLWKLMRRFTELYPGDPALIAPLYLNPFTLRPGEALFLRAGVPHAYVHGLGIELMANSDNVLRGGLTRKHVDVGELTRVLDFSPLQPEILQPPPGNPDGLTRFTYPAPCDEFALSVYDSAGREMAFAESGPAICVLVAGEALLAGSRDTLSLKQGESAFIPAGAAKPLRLRGKCTLYAASLPAP